MRNAALAPVPAEVASPVPDEDFAGLYRKYQPQLLRYVTHHFGPRDADEVTQEAMTRALRALDRRRSEAEAWAWLVRVARNVAHDLARSRRVCETSADGLVAHEAPEEAVQPEPAALLDERRRLVRRALLMLPPLQRRILVLYEIDDVSCPTIARLVGSTEDAVRKALQRGRRRFAAEIRALGGGTAGSLAVLFRPAGWLRRRVRGVPAAGASTALCALAGTVALTVARHPGVVDRVPDQSAPVAVTIGSNDPHDAAARVGAVGSAFGRGATLSGRTHPADRADAPHGLVRLPSTPLGPRQHTQIAHYRIPTPVGTVVVDSDLVTGEGQSTVCQVPGVECE